MRPAMHAKPRQTPTDYAALGRDIAAQFPIVLRTLAVHERLEDLHGLAAYLASPYTHYAAGHDAAAHAAASIAAKLMRMGLSVYSPIVHGHALCQVSDIDPVNQHLWQRIDQPWVDAAQACIVATLPGWDTSRGVAHEIASFLAAGKPVIYLDPQSL